jgi:hypothetical protein
VRVRGQCSKKTPVQPRTPSYCVVIGLCTPIPRTPQNRSSGLTPSATAESCLVEVPTSSLRSRSPSSLFPTYLPYGNDSPTSASLFEIRVIAAYLCYLRPVLLHSLPDSPPCRRPCDLLDATTGDSVRSVDKIRRATWIHTREHPPKQMPVLLQINHCKRKSVR